MKIPKNTPIPVHTNDDSLMFVLHEFSEDGVAAWAPFVPSSVTMRFEDKSVPVRLFALDPSATQYDVIIRFMHHSNPDGAKMYLRNGSGENACDTIGLNWHYPIFTTPDRMWNINHKQAQTTIGRYSLSRFFTALSNPLKQKMGGTIYVEANAKMVAAFFAVNFEDFRLMGIIQVLNGRLRQM